MRCCTFFLVKIIGACIYPLNNHKIFCFSQQYFVGAIEGRNVHQQDGTDSKVTKKVTSKHNLDHQKNAVRIEYTSTTILDFTATKKRKLVYNVTFFLE